MVEDDAVRRRHITAEASGWFARRDAGDLSDAEQQQFQDWLAADPRHRTAFAKLDALWSGLGAAPPEARQGAARALRRRRDRDRRVVIGGLLAVVGTGALAGLLMRRSAPVRSYATKLGERRSVVLADGSRVQLNSATAIRAQVAGDRRRVFMESGEAAFNVAADAARPFVVESRGGSAAARGTAYLVRIDGDQTIVTVLEHAVDVSYPAAQGGERRLSAGQQLRYGAGRMGDTVSVDSYVAAAWRRGQIMVEDRPVAEVIAEIGRYTARPIRMEGDRVRERRVSGVFPADAPMVALQTLGEQLGLSVVPQADGSILVR